jgi:sigma-E factor negative regulatory protein RseB
MKLLAAAAEAGQNVSYQGVEIIARSTMTGTSTVLSTISHSSGGATVTETTQAAASTAAGTQLSYDPYQNLPEGVFGVTKPLVTLLAAHYVAVLKGTDTVAGRPARVIELHRMNGQLAARFWLDDQTGLPLRREDYDTQSQLITEATFIQVSFGEVQASPSPATPASTGWNGVAVPATLVSTLRTKGWPLPAVLPGGLSLYAGAVSNVGAVDLSYSDGLFEVSLFVQRGILSPKLAGWQPAKLGGRSVLISARGVTWSASGYVYTVVSDASPDVVTEAVTALPHDTPPGFWSRLGRGLHRLGHMVDPFR